MKRLNTYDSSISFYQIHLPSFFSLFFFLLITSNLLAQSRIYRKYATQSVETRLLMGNEVLKKEKRSIEQFVYQQRLSGELPDITIPIVFHIVHHDQITPITTADIANQLERLNSDFAGVAANFVHPQESLSSFDFFKAEATGIQFCLAIDKASPEVSAIQFYPTQRLEWTTDNAIKSAESGGASPWNTDDFLNIWVTDLADNVSGYAQMPGGATATDGIIIDKDFFFHTANGSDPYAAGKTLTHLVGSYLGLHELWQENKRCTDDYVADTPIHNAPNFGPMQGKGHISTCHGRPIEMSMNFMDNTDDAFVYMFTQGQRLRMHKMLSEGGPRYTLRQGNTSCQPASIEPIAAISRNTNSSTDELLKIYPNPATYQLFLERSNLERPTQKAALPIAIFHASGQLMYQTAWGATAATLRVDMQDWPAGMYFVQVSLQGVMATKKFTILK